MDLLSLKRGLLPMRGVLMPSDGGSESGRDGSSDGRGGGESSRGGGNGGSSRSSSLGSGLSLSSAGLGFGAGYGYTGAGTTSLGSGLTDSQGRSQIGGSGISYGGNGGSGSTIGGKLGGNLSGYGDLGLSVSQRIGMEGYLSKAATAEKTAIAKILDVAISLAIPASSVVNMISKATTDKTLGQHLAGLVSSGEISSGQAQAFGTALSNNGFNLGGGGSGGGGSGGGRLPGVGNTTTGSTPNPGATAGDSTMPTGPLDDIFSAFVMPEYDPDPSGLVAGGKQSMTDYDTLYKPYAQKMMAEVDRTGTPEFLAQQRTQAMADQQSQYDNTMQQNMRGLSRMGVNPNSGRMLAMQNQGAISNASAKVAAAAKAEGMLRDNYQSGLAAVNSMGMDVAKMGQGWANIGSDAAKTKSAWGLGAAELGLKATAQNQNNAVSWGQIAANRYATDKGVLQTQMRNDAASDQATTNNLWDIGGLALQSWLKPSATSSSSSNWWEY